MRLADVLVDLAAVLRVSRSVASKHVALRARQLDHYGKTSSILDGLRQQSRQGSAPRSETGPQTTASRDAAQGSHSQPISEQKSTPSPFEEGASSTHAENLRPRPSTGISPVPNQSLDAQGITNAGGRSTTKSQFVPAPWASLASSGIVHQTSPAARDAEPASKLTIAGGADIDSVTPGIDVNIFRTARGSKILKSLEPLEPLEQASAGNAADIKTEHGPSLSPTADPPRHEEPGSKPPRAQPEFPEREGMVEPQVYRESQLHDDTAAKLDSIETETSSAAHDPPAYRIDFLQGTKSAAEEPTTDPAKAQEKLSKEDAELVGDLTGAAPMTSPYQLRESKVPATRISRLWNYGGLAASMFAGAIGEGLSRAVGGGGQGSMILSAGNMERLVAKLSRMRGAALKLGQMMSFQDSKMLPAPIQEVLQRVQDRADYMPSWQRDKVLVTNLGPQWRELFDKFDEKPIAAASIGQVHRATLRSNGAEVAVKIQFPGVADSINSDLDNLGVLLAATRLLPRGLYLNKTIENARTELAWECDYEREAICAERYRNLLVDESDVFLVPKIYLEASGKHVLTMEYMEGIGVTRVQSFNQEQRDWIGTQILRLCLREITEFKFMQTDPNWTNFLYNAQTKKLELLDFGASREYPDKFITLYVQLLAAASRLDKAAVKTLSEELGYLTGHESKAMLDAHITSVLTLAEPFLDSAPQVYDFRDQTITERVKDQIPVMIRERLAPPPEETYSLHRKLSGAFLLCARLGSRVRCRDLFEQALKNADFVRS